MIYGNLPRTTIIYIRKGGIAGLSKSVFMGVNGRGDVVLILV
jgi:hypothetical protein